MAVSKRHPKPQDIDLNVATNRIWFDVRDAITGTVQLVAKDQTAGTSVVTLKRSNDGMEAFGLEGAGITLGPGNAMSDEFDMSGFLFLCVEVTTAEGSAQIGTVTVCYTVET